MPRKKYKLFIELKKWKKKLAKKIFFNFNKLIYIYQYIKKIKIIKIKWGLGIGDWAQSPIPNPQSPIPNPQSPKIKIITPNIIL